MGETSFGQYLRQLRKAKNISMYELAHKSGCTHTYISLIETDQKKNVSPNILRRVAKTLKVSYIGILIKAGHVTEEEVLTFRREHGIND